MDDHHSSNSLAARLAACEAELTRLRGGQRARRRREWLAGAAAGGLALLGALAVTGFARGGLAPASGARARAGALDADTLRVRELVVRELVVVDAAGTVRARVGGDLPDAVDASGRRLVRGQKAAGVLLYDAQGLERGGYVTFSPSGHVGLTLDTKDRMVASFLAGPSGGGLLQLTNGGVVQVEDGAEGGTTERAELRADRTEGARLNVLHAGQVVAQTPALMPAQQRATCAAMRDELLRQAQLRADAARKVCGERMPAAACAACFGTAP